MIYGFEDLFIYLLLWRAIKESDSFILYPILTNDILKIGLSKVNTLGNIQKLNLGLLFIIYQLWQLM